MKFKHKILLIFIVFFSNYFLDRITKILAERFIPTNKIISKLGGMIRLHLVYNEGAFLSFGSSFDAILKLLIMIILPLVFCVGVILYCIFKENDKIAIIILISIVAGGVGNLQDRIFNDGAVTDFMQFSIWKFKTGVLNVADMSITFGFIFFFIYEVWKTNKNKQKEVI